MYESHHVTRTEKDLAGGLFAGSVSDVIIGGGELFVVAGEHECLALPSV